jgi:hypothetical protein
LNRNADLTFPFKGKVGMGMGIIHSDSAVLTFPILPRAALISPSPSRGRLGWGWGTPLPQRSPNRSRHPVNIPQHLVVPETQDPEPCTLEIFRPCCVFDFALAMLTSIHFYGKHRLETNEIDYVISEGVLSAKPEFRNLLSPQRAPQALLSVCHALA